MDNHRLGVRLVGVCDEVGKVSDGLDGFLGLIADRPGKEVRMRRDALYHAIEPLFQRMKAAQQQLNELRIAVTRGGESGHA